MIKEILQRKSIIWIALGLLAVGYATFGTYQAFPLRPPHPAADNIGLAWLIITPIAVLGGILIAHGMYRWDNRNRRTLRDALIYPVSAVVASSIPVLFVALNPYYPSPSGMVLLQFLAFSILVGVTIAGIIWNLDRWRGRTAVTAPG